MFLFFFFNDTATTEIHTDVHTLSLHDALPIGPSGLQDGGGADRKGKGDRIAESVGEEDLRNRIDDVARRQREDVATVAQMGIGHVVLQVDDALRPPGASRRSEAHTSELQSLMRISYAVFCLKKKQQNTR